MGLSKKGSLFFLFLNFIPGFGQMSYIFNRFSRNEGLNTNNVNCVWQDKKGFLWIGTENGIQRFDGRNFVSFSSVALNQAMPPLGVDQILDAGEGKMWLRQGNHIGLFDPVSFSYSNISVKNQKQLPTQSEFKKLVTVLGSNDCHSPKVMTAKGPAFDTLRLLSGHQTEIAFFCIHLNFTELVTWELPARFINVNN